jgi:hypothetical protein
MVRGEELQGGLLRGRAEVGSQFGGDDLVQGWDAGFEDA